MHDWIDSYLLVLARLYLENEQSFVVRRSVQRVAAGEISAREAIRRIRRCPLVLDGADLTVKEPGNAVYGLAHYAPEMAAEGIEMRTTPAPRQSNRP